MRDPAPRVAGTPAGGAGIDIQVLERTAGTKVVIPSGEIDLATAHMLEAEIAKVLDSGPERVMLDLSKLTFMDLCGVRVIVRSEQRSSERRIAFELIPGTGQVRRLLDVCGLLDTPIAERHPWSNVRCAMAQNPNGARG